MTSMWDDDRNMWMNSMTLQGLSAALLSVLDLVSGFSVLPWKWSGCLDEILGVCGYMPLSDVVWKKFIGFVCEM